MGNVEQREAFRFPTDLEADCRMAGESWAARLRNISTTGCMMATPDTGLPSGWMMRLRIRTLPAIDAEIIWRHRGHAGLRFLTPLQTTALQHLGFQLPEPRRPGELEPTRPGALHARLVKRTAPEEGIAAATGLEVRGAPQHVS
jgi:hypothetical protein